MKPNDIERAEVLRDWPEPAMTTPRTPLETLKLKRYVLDAILKASEVGDAPVIRTRRHLHGQWVKFSDVEAALARVEPPDDPFRGELSIYRHDKWIMGINPPHVEAVLAAIDVVLEASMFPKDACVEQNNIADKKGWEDKKEWEARYVRLYEKTSEAALAQKEQL